MAYLGDGISSDFDEEIPLEEGVESEEESKTVPLVPVEELGEDEEFEEEK